MKFGLSVVVCAIALGACSAKVTPPSVEIEANPVSVEVGSSGGGSSDGKFCPPGQAKKGRC